MSTSNLILIAVVVAVVLLLAVVTGIVLARRRRISLREQEAERPAVQGGGYQAGGGFSFSSGATATAPPEHPVEQRPETEGQPGVGDDAAEPRDSARRGIVDVPLPAETEVEAETGAPREQPADRTGTTEDTTATDATTKAAEDEATESDGATAVGKVEDTTDTAPPTEVPEQGRTATPPDPAPAVAEPVTEIEEIEPTSGRLERLRGRLSRSRSTFGQGLLGLLGAGDLDEDSWEEVEDTLLMADLGAATTTEIVERLRTEIASRGVRTPDDARALLREVLIDALSTDAPRAVRALPHGDPADGGKPAVLLVVGVNGTGKTTTTGKLARVLIADGHKVLLGAADTFRAAAVEQLATWGERVGAEVVRGNEGQDPASVAFESVSRAGDTGVDAVLVDTAGRLHTKTGLMDELGKVKRVVEKRAQVDEVLLVLDATTGQNGLVQARVFSEVVDVTGIVLTKLDGTAKGGIVFQVQRELGVPVKLVGLGEGADHLAPFEPAAFVDALLG
ncbi:signal recognition particle-docking protein FtsY [Saccharopolyspora gloriosae]|uniref:signal recognition particle-docking protein FtsY n=1 Tax=Saccharopolyspora gloriosae TaxID=455344 RepID=UPI001FB84942|nr:signal recognition particle-docking protein FtsY [Saccharopolyspora gloriosae]